MTAARHVCLFAAVSFAAYAAQPRTLATTLTTELVASGLTRPIGIAHAPGDTTRVFIIEKRGVITLLHLDGGGLSTFLDIDARIGGGTTNYSEQGLLGLAFHPDYNSNGYFYVDYTDNSGNTNVSRFSVTAGDPDTADPDSEYNLLTIAQPQTNHNAGWLHFGPDAYLYIATGDGGGAGDDDTGHTLGVGNGQDITDNLLGKILRIDVDGTNGPSGRYGIPPDNPFVGVTGDDQIWAFGLRNPWRDSFDTLTGDLWIADVGQDLWEEIDFQPAGDPGGENYGWRCREGFHDYDTTGDCSATPFTDPIYEYSHGGSPSRCSITGGEIYRGCAIPDLRGAYFFADYCSAQIWSLRYDPQTQTVYDFTDRTAELAPCCALNIRSITSFGRDANGEIYICDQNDGEVFRIIPAGAVDAPTPFDYDNDGQAAPDVDLFDYFGFADCITGPDGSYADCLCDVFDADADGDIDLIDFAGFQSAFTGP